MKCCTKALPNNNHLRCRLSVHATIVDWHANVRSMIQPTRIQMPNADSKSNSADTPGTTLGGVNSPSARVLFQYPNHASHLPALLVRDQLVRDPMAPLNLRHFVISIRLTSSQVRIHSGNTNLNDGRTILLCSTDPILPSLICEHGKQTNGSRAVRGAVSGFGVRFFA